ncbi:MAG: hypothetical protein ABI619_04675 [Betaproteobacteria bacterium]
MDTTLERFAVHACFDGSRPRSLVASSDGARLYLESMRIGERLIEPAGDRVVIAAGTERCVDYQVKLQPARTEVQTGGPETRRFGRNLLTSIGDWLWRPDEPQTDIELRFDLPAGFEVSAPWPRQTTSPETAVFVLGATPHDWSGVVALGRFTPRAIEVPGAVLHVAMLNVSASRQTQLEHWIEGAARNAAQLYGRFPVPRVQIIVVPARGGTSPVPWAYVSRGGGPAIHLFVDTTRPLSELEHDWSLTHEMSHLFLPYVVSRDAWLFEGIPTYLQNVLMARGGAIDVELAWARMRSGFQSGARVHPELSLARANDRIAYGNSLRVYWAGAAMMLRADILLRERSRGTQSLDSALEQLSRCCALEPRRWSAQEVIARLDELTATTIFSDVARDQFAAEGFPDYAYTLARAGVIFDGGQLTFDNAAPWAAERDALMRSAR